MTPEEQRQLWARLSSQADAIQATWPKYAFFFRNPPKRRPVLPTFTLKRSTTRVDSTAEFAFPSDEGAVHFAEQVANDHLPEGNIEIVRLDKDGLPARPIATVYAQLVVRARSTP